MGKPCQRKGENFWGQPAIDRRSDNPASKHYVPPGCEVRGPEATPLWKMTKNGLKPAARQSSLMEFWGQPVRSRDNSAADTPVMG